MKKSEYTPHNEKYALLQEQYLQTRDKKVLGDMYQIIWQIEKNYINKYCQKNHIKMDDISMADHIENACTFIIEQYLRKPEFKIEKISAYCHFGMLKSLFTDKDMEMSEDSWDELIEKGEHEENY